MATGKGSPAGDAVVLVEDGQIFLNREELDEYRTQKIQMQQEEEEWASMYTARW